MRTLFSRTRHAAPSPPTSPYRGAPVGYRSPVPKDVLERRVRPSEVAMMKPLSAAVLASLLLL